MLFENKSILITGAATGIGAATAQHFAAEGAHVYALDINPLSYEGDNIHYMACDVRSYDALGECLTKLMGREKTLDYVFCNAGLHTIATLEQTTLEKMADVIDVNLKGVVYTLKHVLPVMRQQMKGSIVLMGSDQCFIGKPASAVYGLTKGAIGQLTKSTAIDYAPYNIKVNCVCPGTVDTPIARNAVQQVSNETGKNLDEVYDLFCDAQPIKRLATPDEIARTVAFLCSDQVGYMTGSLLSVDGGLTAQ